MNIRTLKKSEKAQSIKLWKDSFPHETPAYTNWFYTNLYKEENMLALFDDKLVSQTYLRRVDLKLYDKVVQGEGVGGVGTFTFKRGKGYAKKLLNSSLQFMRERGSVIAFLYPDPVTYEFYEKYGFMLACDRLKIRVTKKELESCFNLPCGADLLDAETKHAQDMSRIYTNSMKDYSFYTSRQKDYFECLALDNGGYDRLKLLKIDDEILAYALWEVDGDFLYLDELIGENAPRLALVYALIKSIGASGAQFYSPIDDTIVKAIGAKRDIAERIKHDAFRILDFAACYSGIITNNEHKSIVVNVLDDLIPQNNGVFRLSVYNNRTIVKKIDDGRAQYYGDIKVFTQLFTGYKSIDECIQEKSIRIIDEVTTHAYFDIFNRKDTAYILDLL